MTGLSYAGRAHNTKQLDKQHCLIYEVNFQIFFLCLDKKKPYKSILITVSMPIKEEEKIWKRSV